MFCTGCDGVTPARRIRRITKDGKVFILEVCDNCGEEQVWETSSVTTVRKKRGETIRVTNEQVKKVKSGGK